MSESEESEFGRDSSADILATDVVNQPTSKLQGCSGFQTLNFRDILDFDQPLLSATQHIHPAPLTLKSRE